MSRTSASISDFIPAAPLEIWDAWLDGASHADMTGASATGKAEVGAAFTAWDGYISGTNVELVPPGLIVQKWRTSQFNADQPDSRVEVQIVAEGTGSRVTVVHSELPDEEQVAQYEQGWVDHYFIPMKDHFGD